MAFCAVVFSSSWSGVELRVMRPVCRMLVNPKHVEQAIRSAIKTSVAPSWHFISTYFLNLFGIGVGTLGGNGAMSPTQEFESL